MNKEEKKKKKEELHCSLSLKKEAQHSFKPLKYFKVSVFLQCPSAMLHHLKEILGIFHSGIVELAKGCSFRGNIHTGTLWCCFSVGFVVSHIC